MPAIETSGLTKEYGDETALSDWFAPVILLVWIAIPAVVGYWRFGGADLN